MSTVTVDNVIKSTDGKLTRSATVNAMIDSDVYEFPVEQDYLKIVNNGSYDIHLNVGGYLNYTIHPTQKFENSVNFTSFTINSDADTQSFTYTSKETDLTPVTVSELWERMKIRDQAESGDVINNTTNDTTSAGTINTAIAGVNGKYSRDVVFTLKNTGGTTHTWYNGVAPVTVSKVSTAGVVVIADGAYATFIDGVATVAIEMTGTWESGDTVTVTVPAFVTYGYTVASKANVDTLGA